MVPFASCTGSMSVQAYVCKGILMQSSDVVGRGVAAGIQLKLHTPHHHTQCLVHSLYDVCMSKDLLHALGNK